MKSTYLLLLFFALLSFTGYGQDCNCSQNFEWVKSTFEENDAGFTFVLESKGEEAYAEHNKTFREKVNQITDYDECTGTIYDWLTFFRSGHISLRNLNGGSAQGAAESEEDIIKRFQDWQRLDVNLDEFRAYLETKTTHDFEGIWVSEPYTIGIKKVDEEYHGFIIEADGIYWTPGQIKLKIAEDLSAIYYMRDHSGQNFASAKMLGKNYLEMGFISLRRTAPVIRTEPVIERYYRAISADDPYFERINEETVLMRIPRFWGSEKHKIDSVINANKAAILATPNFIIDLRNNGGGSDGSFEELIPILYTNPIRTVGVKLLSTPLNNQRMLDFINDDDYGFDEEDKQWAQESYDKLSEQLGEFVMLNENRVSIDSFDTVHEFPRNIGIIINENNGSTTEQFLLAAKQSKKVKLFGTTTAGVLDISNMYFVASPCNEFELGYCLSKSMRIPEMTIDEKGIAPDYYIDRDIPKYHWIDFVTQILNQ